MHQAEGLDMWGEGGPGKPKLLVENGYQLSPTPLILKL